MKLHHRRGFRDLLGKYTLIVYLLSLVLLIVLPPFYASYNNRGIIDSIILSLNLIASSAFLEGLTKKKFFTYLTLLAISCVWIDDFFPGKLVDLISNFGYITLTLFSFIHIFRVVFKSKEVNTQILLATVSGYFLMGVLYAILSSVLYSYQNNAFVFNTTSEPKFYDMIYYSFVTLTTLGYGDITPISTQAKSLSILITITGQLYLTVMVGMIVGKYISSETFKK